MARGYANSYEADLAEMLEMPMEQEMEQPIPMDPTPVSSWQSFSQLAPAQKAATQEAPAPMAAEKPMAEPTPISQRVKAGAKGFVPLGGNASAEVADRLDWSVTR